MNATPPTSTPAPNDLSRVPPRVLLIGKPSAGKTHAIRTLVRNGITPCIVALEYPDVLEDTKPGEVMWHYVKPTIEDWATVRDNAIKVNSLSNDALQKLPGINREKYRQFLTILDTLQNFVDDRTGAKLGDVMTWGPDKALVIESLSVLTLTIKRLAVGAKPILSQPDYMVIMENIDQFIQQCVFSLPCMFILTAHVEKEYNEVDGTNDAMVSTIGRKLAPKIPQYFTDAIYVRQDPNGTRYWDTSGAFVDSKYRNLPIDGKLKPDFDLLISNWRKRQAK